MSGSRRRPPGCAWRLVDLYGLTMVAYLLAWWATGDRFLVVYALGYVAHLALPLAFVWLPFSLLRRRWASLAIQGVCAVTFLWLFGDALTGDDPPTPPVGAPIVTALTYNLGNGLAAPSDLVPLLRASGADIVGLQELTTETAAGLTAGLADAYPHQALHPLGTPGKGLLSRYPIVRSELLQLNPDRPDLLAVLDVDGVEVTVIVTHPPPLQLTTSGLTRRPGAVEHIAALLEVVEATDGPLLLLGDLNLTRMHDVYGKLEGAGLRDAYRAAGDDLGFTAPIRFQALTDRGLPFARTAVPAILRIDYVWASRHWQPVDARVGDDAGSDHLPVLVRLALIDPGGEVGGPASPPRAPLSRRTVGPGPPA